jgi:hypothetical protein
VLLAWGLLWGGRVFQVPRVRRGSHFAGPPVAPPSWPRPVRAPPRGSAPHAAGCPRRRSPAAERARGSCLLRRLLSRAPRSQPRGRLRRAVLACSRGAYSASRVSELAPASAPSPWPPWCWRTGRCCGAGPSGPPCRLLGKWVSKPGRLPTSSHYDTPLRPTCTAQTLPAHPLSPTRWLRPQPLSSLTTRAAFTGVYSAPGSVAKGVLARAQPCLFLQCSKPAWSAIPRPSLTLPTKHKS